MFKAIGKYFRALGYLLTGRINKMSETLRQDPNVMAASYDKIIDDKKASINQYKDAIGKMLESEKDQQITALGLACTCPWPGSNPLFPRSRFLRLTFRKRHPAVLASPRAPSQNR